MKFRKYVSKNKMNKINIIADLSFYQSDRKPQTRKTKIENGMIVAIKISDDMFNSGKISFIDREYALPGDNNIRASVLFAYDELVKPFLKVGKKFTFGETTYLYGEGIIVEIVE